MSFDDYVKKQLGEPQRRIFSAAESHVPEDGVQHRAVLAGVNGPAVLGRPCRFLYHILRRVGATVLVYAGAVDGTWSSEGVVVDGNILTAASPKWPGRLAEKRFADDTPNDIWPAHFR